MLPPFPTLIAASLAVLALAGPSARSEPARAPAAMVLRPPAVTHPPGTRPGSASHFCADRCAQPVVGLTCGLTHIVDPPSFRAGVRPCVLEIDASGEPGARLIEE